MNKQFAILAILTVFISTAVSHGQTTSPLPPPASTGPGIYTPDLSILCCINVPDLDTL